jgi:hypothetical protein
MTPETPENRFTRIENFLSTVGEHQPHMAGQQTRRAEEQARLAEEQTRLVASQNRVAEQQIILTGHQAYVAERQERHDRDIE